MTNKAIPVWIEALRPYHWTKNVLLFSGFALGARLNDSNAFNVLLAFGSFSLCSSAGYLLNDFCDLRADRLHPRKSKRPLVSMRITLAKAVFLAVSCLGTGVLIAMFLPAAFQAVLAIYLIVSIAYSFVLKHVKFVDLCIMSGFYLLRIWAGLAVTGIVIPLWLISICVPFFLSLALLKRYSDFQASGERDKYPREIRKTLPMLGLAAAVAFAVILALWIARGELGSLYPSAGYLYLLCVIGLGWVYRLWSAYSRGNSREPIIYVIRDPATYVAGATSVFACVLASMP